MYKRGVFDALKKQYQGSRNFKLLLQNVFTNVSRHQLRESFDDIKQRAKFVSYHQGKDKINGVKLMGDLNMRLEHKNLQKMFDKFKVNGIKRDQKA